MKLLIGLLLIAALQVRADRDEEETCKPKCKSSRDCEDYGPCVDVECRHGVCIYEKIKDCCIKDKDCEKEDSCLEYKCNKERNRCFALPSPLTYGDYFATGPSSLLGGGDILYRFTPEGGKRSIGPVTADGEPLRVLSMAVNPTNLQLNAVVTSTGPNTTLFLATINTILGTAQLYDRFAFGDASSEITFNRDGLLYFVLRGFGNTNFLDTYNLTTGISSLQGSFNSSEFAGLGLSFSDRGSLYFSPQLEPQALLNLDPNTAQILARLRLTPFHLGLPINALTEATSGLAGLFSGRFFTVNERTGFTEIDFTQQNLTTLATELEGCCKRERDCNRFKTDFCSVSTCIEGNCVSSRKSNCCTRDENCQSLDPSARGECNTRTHECVFAPAGVITGGLLTTDNGFIRRDFALLSTQILVNGVTPVNITVMAMSPTTLALFGTVSIQQGTPFPQQLLAINTTGFAKALGRVEPRLTDMEFDADGVLYGFDFDGNLYRINPITAATTFIGFSQLRPFVGGGFTFVPPLTTPQRALVSYQRFPTSLTQINKNTGAVQQNVSITPDPGLPGPMTSLAGLDDTRLYGLVFTDAETRQLALISLDPSETINLRDLRNGTSAIAMEFRKRCNSNLDCAQFNSLCTLSRCGMFVGFRYCVTDFTC